MKSEARDFNPKSGFQGAFKRPCKGCDELYYPTGRHGKYCDNCILKRRRKCATKRVGMDVTRISDRI